jgi:hypothetical protein
LKSGAAFSTYGFVRTCLMLAASHMVFVFVAILFWQFCILAIIEGDQQMHSRSRSTEQVLPELL